MRPKRALASGCDMRFAFFGTSRFASHILDRLLEAGQGPLLVMTQPDAVSKRGRELQPSAVARRADRGGLDLAKPTGLSDPDFVRHLAELELDCVILAAYGRIIPARLLEIPRCGWINVHASLLPRWRGAAPIQRAILAGDAQTGVSIMRMEVGLDTGPQCAQAPVPLQNKSATQLEDELARVGATLLLEGLPKIISGEVSWQEQDEAGATYAEKIRKHELDLDPHKTAEMNVRKVRASTDSAPASFRLVSGDRVLTMRALAAKRQGRAACPAPGSAEVRDDHIALFCASEDEYCAITQLQPAGRRPLSVAEFSRGFRPEKTLSWR